MRYALLICTDEHTEEARGPDEVAAILAQYGTFTEEMGRRGVLRGGERLRHASEATTVRVREGRTLTADGPFAETKEQVGGFFLVECADIDEAIEIAGKIPHARAGCVEVRPIWEMETT